jgi:transketolase
MRNTLISLLCEEARINPNLYLLVGDLGWSVVEPFQEAYPSQFINVGVAEQNMVGVGAGLASEGSHVFAYSIGSFPTWRCAEQLRNDIDYHNLSYTTVTVGSGVTYGKLGYSHHAIQDIALMRSLPNTLMLCPCDSLETSACIKYILANPGPSYLRLHKAGEPVVSSKESILPCELNYLHSASSSKIILTTGISGQDAYKRKSDIYEHCDIATIPIWSSLHGKNLVKQLSKYKSIHTIEDHLIAGGFGYWIFEQFQIHRDCLQANPPSISCSYFDSSILSLVGDPDYIKDIARV